MSRLLFAGLLLGLMTQPVAALSLGPDEFAAAKRLTCVLAQDSLGYLSEQEYVELTDQVLEELEAESGDVVYAKALGYFDGLMFGIPEEDEQAVAQRLRSYLDSHACGSLMAVQFRS